MLPQAKGKTTTSRVAATSVAIYPRLRADRKALFVTFSNLSKIKNISYTLIYQTNGRDEGAGGSVSSSQGQTTTRELLFGTCSAGVCRYHTNITTMKFEVSISYANGKKVLRRYKIRI